MAYGWKREAQGASIASIAFLAQETRHATTRLRAEALQRAGAMDATRRERRDTSDEERRRKGDGGKRMVTAVATAPGVGEQGSFIAWLNLSGSPGLSRSVLPQETV
jgi:hypothetical protein